MTLDAPVIVLGAPRSGTSILGELLGAHPDVCYVVEPRLTWRFGNDRRSDMLDASDARPAVRSHIRERLASMLADSGRSRLIEKTPANALRPEFVDRVLPDCLFVHIVRSGYSAVESIRHSWTQHARGVDVSPIGGRGRVAARLDELSWRRRPAYAMEALRRVAPEWGQRFIGPATWGPIIPGLRGLVKELDTLDIACLQWRMCTERAASYGRRLPVGRYLEVKLEELDGPALDRILDHCGLSDGADAVRGAYRERFDVAAARKEATLTPGERERVAEWIEPTMTWLGYS